MVNYCNQELRFQAWLNHIYFINLVAIQPRVSLHPEPSYFTEGSDVTFPVCHVTGYPAPVVTWRKSSRQLPQGRVHYNNSVLQISNVRKINLLEIDERKTHLVVGSLPVFALSHLERCSLLLAIL